MARREDTCKALGNVVLAVLPHIHILSFNSSNISVGETMIDIKRIIEEQLMNDKEEQRREAEPIEFFHASSLGYCDRQIFLTKIHAKTFDVFTRGKMEIGSSIHHRIQHYPEIRELFDVEVPVKIAVEGTSLVIVGSADLVAKDKSVCQDIKSINGLTYVQTRPMAEHIVQVNAYLRALDIINGEIVYVNKTDMNIIVHPFNYNANLFKQTCEKILRVFDALKRFDNNGTFNMDEIPPKCGCFFCNSEQLSPNFERLLK
jgi:hypothetical protein